MSIHLGRRRLRRLLIIALAVLTALPLSIFLATERATAAAPTADPARSCMVAPGGFLSEGPTDWRSFPRPLGKVKMAMLFVDFADAPADTSVDSELEIFSTESEDWYATSSYGKFDLDIVPYKRWLRLPSSLNEYARTHPLMTARDGRPDVVTDDPMLASIFRNAVQLADPYFDFSQTDALLLVPSRRSSYSRGYATFEHISADGNTILAETNLATSRYRDGHILLNHEGGHLISLPDTYGGPGGFGWTGGWDVMGHMWGPAPDQFAWHKWKVGWLDDAQIACLATRNAVIEHTVTPVETPGGTKAVVVRYGTNTAYIAEVRQRLGLDTRACDTGVLVYRVDSRTPSGSGPVRVMDSHPNTGCGNNGLNDATYDLGPGEVSTFTDTANAVRIQVMAKSGNDFTVRATFGTPASDDFAMSVAPSSGQVTAGGSTSATVATSVTSGSAQRVALSASGLPSGASAVFEPAEVTAGGSSRMTISTTASTPNGTYPVSVVGRGATASRTATFTLTVGTPPPVDFADDFESDKGWRVNPNGTDTAGSGRWERAQPQSTTHNGITVQNGTTPGPGTYDLVTGAAAGTEVGANDVDGGVTSVQSPAITLAAGVSYRLRFSHYLAHLDNATAEDYLRVRVVHSGGTTTVFERKAAASNAGGTFATADVSLTAYAGQAIRLLVETADAGTGSLIEAAIDNVEVLRGP